MAYDFNFDLTKISRSFFKKLAKFSDEKGVHKEIGSITQEAAKKFKVKKITGIPASDVMKVVNDMVDIHVKNLVEREEFAKRENRAIFLPHCSRRYMDNRCQAEFDTELSTYRCRQCSDDCLVNKATEIGEEMGYDVYVLPGGSCIKKIMKEKKYDGIVGVACPMEIQMGMEYLKDTSVSYQGVPLLKNGCSNTKFNLDTYKELVDTSKK